MSDKHETHHLYTLPVDGFLGLAFEREGDAGVITLAAQGEGSAEERAARDAQRRELIERSRRGDQVELLLTAQTYAQKDDTPNRNYIEFSPRALQNIAKTAPGTPFLRDHRLFNTESSGGFAVSAQLKRDDDGGRRLVEDIRLTTPWAVQAALEGRMRKFSISIDPLGDVRATLKCMGCGKLVAECRHYPGEKVETRSGQRIVTWLYADAAIVERSWVLYPAVDQTGPENIRQFMAHYLGGPSMNIEKDRDKTADTGQASQNHEREALAAMVQDLTTQLTTAQQRIEELETKLKTSEDDKRAQELATKREALGAAIDELCKTGHLLPNGAQEKAIRAKLDGGDLDGAQALVDFAKSSPAVSPAGAPRQSPGGGGHALPRTGDGKIDFHAVFKNLPEHLKSAAGPYAKNPEPFIRANRSTIARHGIDLSALDQ